MTTFLPKKSDSIYHAIDYQSIIIELQFMQLPQYRPISDRFALVDSQLLGKGSTGNVYLGFAIQAPERKVAIKAIDLKEIDNEVTRYLLSCEIAALSNLGKLDHTAHENVVKLLDVALLDGYIYLVTELLQGGTLAQHLKRHPNGLHEEEAMVIFRQIVEGYRHIRGKGVVHRDIKPDNILFKTKPEISKKIAIIDFGYCEMSQVPNKPQMFYNVGSPKYMAPEAYVENVYSEKSDIWALGVILYEMLVGKTCDQGLKMEAYLEMLKKTGIPIPGHVSPFFKHLLSKMLCYNQQARFDCLQVIKEMENYQNSFQPYHSQANHRPFNETTTSNDFFNLRAGRNNQVFKSAMVGQNPPQLFHSQHQPNIIAHQHHPTNVPPQCSDGLAEKRILKTSSARNVGTQIAFNNSPKNVLQKVENAYSPLNRVIQIKSTRPNFQPSPHISPMDASFPSHKVHFKVVPAQHNHRENIQPPRFPADENQFHLKNPNLDRRVQIINHPVITINKRSNPKIFHSPQRKPPTQSLKVQFFTQKKLKDQESPRRQVVELRPFNGQVRRPPIFGQAPLFH